MTETVGFANWLLEHNQVLEDNAASLRSSVRLAKHDHADRVRGVVEPESMPDCVSVFARVLVGRDVHPLVEFAVEIDSEPCVGAT